MKINIAIALIAASVAIASLHAAGTARSLQDPSPTAQASASQPSKSVWDGVYTEEQAKRGAGVYRQWCSSCHGNELEGGEMAPGLSGGGFSSNWNGLTVGDIFDRTRTTMPQDSPGALTREQVSDVTAYVLSVNKFPAGQTELPTQSEVLKQIKFEATKPGH
jgi:mono/diheme cytochrome c family protein